MRANVDLGQRHPSARAAAVGRRRGGNPGSNPSGSGGTTGTGTGSGGAGGGGPTTSGDGGPLSQRDAEVDTGDDAGQDVVDAGGCPAHFADCDGETSNGCEVDLDTTFDHCGSCDRVCPGFGFMSFGSTCVGGRCDLTCEAPHEDCDGNPDNGCEADLRFGTSANSNCGACGVVCDCNNGVCN